MDYLKHLDLILSKSLSQGYSDFALRIVEVRRGASTVSEPLMSVTHELLKEIKRDPGLSALIKNEVVQLN